MISKDGYVGWKVHEVNFLPLQLSSFTKLSSFKDHVHLHTVFTDRHHIFASGIPAHGINTLSVALQFPRNQIIRVASSDPFSITGEL